MSRLTHVDDTGRAHMVDVSAKPMTVRSAKAQGRIVMSQAAFRAVQTNSVAKGDVLAVARIAGIMAAKKTADLIPLCHPLALASVVVDFTLQDDLKGIDVTVTVKSSGPTGVEMEALTATSAALLTIYDMAKALDKGMRIEGIRLLEKSGGKSGNWRAENQLPQGG